MGLYWEPCPGGARLLRLLGDTPCPAVPGTIEGLPVAELGPYCFADRPVRPGARRTGDDAHEITGNFVEEVTLPDTVRVLDSAAFYNCRRLRRLKDPVQLQRCLRNGTGVFDVDLAVGKLCFQRIVFSFQLVFALFERKDDFN